MSFYNENAMLKTKYTTGQVNVVHNTKDRVNLEIAQIKMRLSELEELKAILEENPKLERAITLLRHF